MSNELISGGRKMPNCARPLFVCLALGFAVQHASAQSNEFFTDAVSGASAIGQAGVTNRNPVVQGGGLGGGMVRQGAAVPTGAPVQMQNTTVNVRPYGPATSSPPFDPRLMQQLKNSVATMPVQPRTTVAPVSPVPNYNNPPAAAATGFGAPNQPALSYNRSVIIPNGQPVIQVPRGVQVAPLPQPLPRPIVVPIRRR